MEWSFTEKLVLFLFKLYNALQTVTTTGCSAEVAQIDKERGLTLSQRWLNGTLSLSS